MEALEGLHAAPVVHRKLRRVEEVIPVRTVWRHASKEDGLTRE